MEHPGKMLPAIARYLIATYTQIGEYVCDPMAGIATTVVEAMHLGRHGIGVEYEPRWARLAADNIQLANAQGASGSGEIVQGDARQLPALIPAQLHGRIALVIASPPYGPSTHGHVRTPDYGCTRNAPRSSPASATAGSYPAPRSSNRRTSAPLSPTAIPNGSCNTRTYSCSSAPGLPEVRANARTANRSRPSARAVR